jgi:hypothetical protein
LIFTPFNEQIFVKKRLSPEPRDLFCTLDSGRVYEELRSLVSKIKEARLFISLFHDLGLMKQS